MKTSLTFLFVLALVGCGTEAPTGPTAEQLGIPCRTFPFGSRWPRVMCDRGANFTGSAMNPDRYSTVEICADDQRVAVGAMPLRDPVSTHPYATICPGWTIITARDALAVYQ